MTAGKHWTDAEIETLFRLYDTHTELEIGAVLGRSESGGPQASGYVRGY